MTDHAARPDTDGHRHVHNDRGRALARQGNGNR
jgi:hypothetical protein